MQVYIEDVPFKKIGRIKHNAEREKYNCNVDAERY